MNFNFSKTIPIGSLFGINIYADLLVIPAFFLLYALGGIGFFLLALPAFILHEAAHVITAKLIKCNISHITFMPFGAIMELQKPIINDLAQQVALHSAGAIANVTFYSLFYALGTASSSLVLLQMAYVNGILAVISILPAIPLDGSSVLRCILSSKFNERITLNVLFAFSIAICSAALIFAGYIYVVYNEFLWQIISVSLLLLAVSLKERSYPVANSISSIMNKKRLFNQNVTLTQSKHYVHTDAPLISVLRSADHTNFNVYIVTDSSFKPLGELTEQQILDAAIIYGNDAPISKALELLN